MGPSELLLKLSVEENRGVPGFIAIDCAVHAAEISVIIAVGLRPTSAQLRDSVLVMTAVNRIAIYFVETASVTGHSLSATLLYSSVGEACLI